MVEIVKLPLPQDFLVEVALGCVFHDDAERVSGWVAPKVPYYVWVPQVLQDPDFVFGRFRTVSVQSRVDFFEDEFREVFTLLVKVHGPTFPIGPEQSVSERK